MKTFEFWNSGMNGVILDRSPQGGSLRDRSGFEDSALATRSETVRRGAPHCETCPELAEGPLEDSPRDKGID